MRRITFGLLVLLSPLVTGCGGGGPSDLPELGLVSGVVKLDGEPLSGALVSFSPEKGRSSTGETDATGHYKLRYSADHMGAVVGTHKVSISTKRDAVMSEGGTGSDSPAVPEKVPTRYNEDSQLTEEVQKGTNSIDFDLQTKGA